MKRLLAILLLIFLTATSRAATYTAASVAYADVNTALGLCAASGDTVQIPAGSSTWANTLHITKSVVIQGAGTNSTLITNNQGTIFSIEPAADLPVRITQLGIIQPTGCIAYYTINIRGKIKAFRIDHCYFTQGKDIIQTGNGGSGPVFGVIDHCTFYNCSLEIQSFNFQSGDTADGDTLWAAFKASPSTYVGTTNSVVVEDNLFLEDSGITCDNDEPISGGRAGTFTVRKNTFQSKNLTRAYVGADMHGAFSTLRGGLLYQIYSNNYFVATTYRITKQRGGQWITHDNNYFNTNGSTVFHTLGPETSIELTGNANYGDGYTNTYSWRNYCNGVLQTIGNGSLMPAVLNTHFFDRQPQSGDNFYPYTDLVYPHPRVAAEDGGPDTTPPTIAFLTPTNGGYWYTYHPYLTNLTGTIGDASGVTNATATNVSHANITLTGTTTFAGPTSTTNALSTGTNIIRVIANDGAGNVGSNSFVAYYAAWTNVPVAYGGTTLVAQRGIAFSYTVATDGDPTNFGSTNLPTGLSINSSGVISGTPSANMTNLSGVFPTNSFGFGYTNFTIQVRDPIVYVGNTNDVNTLDGLGANAISMVKYFATNDLNANTMYVKVGAITGNYKTAIYSDGTPRALLGQTANINNPSAGWNSGALLANTFLTNGNWYWFATWSDTTGSKIYYQGTTASVRFGSPFTFGTWPSTLSDAQLPNTGLANYGIYASGPPPSAGGDTTPPVMTDFVLPATYGASLTVITDVAATDNIAVGGYYVSESPTTPEVTNSGWTVYAPTNYAFSSAGAKTLYAWAKDTSANVSAPLTSSVTLFWSTANVGTTRVGP